MYNGFRTQHVSNVRDERLVMLALTHYKCVGCKISNVSPIRYICFSSMNKKFFKCNPVRALMVSSTGTFVFCKSIDKLGILLVKCKKTTTASLIPIDGTINVITLKIPRAGDYASWCNNVAHKSCFLVAEPNNVANRSLLNPLADTYKSDGIVPQTTHNKKITVKVYGAINKYNIVEVKKYDICLVAPLKINAKLDGFFEDQIVSGSAIDCSNVFTLTDFAGYEVADIADNASATEYKK